MPPQTRQDRISAGPLSRLHRPGLNPDVILLIGDDDSLHEPDGRGGPDAVNRMADELVARTGRGLDLTLITGPQVTFSAARKAIESGRVWRFDAVLVAFGNRAAGALAGRRGWQRQASDFTDALLREAAPTTDVFLLIGASTQRHRQTLEALDRRSSQIRCGSLTPDARNAGQTLVSLLAEQLSSPGALDAAPRSGSARALRDQPDEELARQQALDALPWQGDAAEERFQEIVEQARRLFATESAEINLIDHDRQWKRAAAGTELTVQPRDISICNLTIQHADATIIPDTHQDDRLLGNPLTLGDRPIRFYAAYPLESPDGYRIGALCVFDSKPRAATDFDVEQLREIALRAQAELWKESTRPAPAPALT